MSQSSNEVDNTFSPQRQMDREWQKIFNELCYEVFYKFKPGAQLLAHMENKFFRSPVAYPNREPSWAFFNEGHNECIRSFTAGMQAFLMESAARKQQEANPLPRRAKVKSK